MHWTLGWSLPAGIALGSMLGLLANWDSTAQAFHHAVSVVSRIL